MQLRKPKRRIGKAIASTALTLIASTTLALSDSKADETNRASEKSAETGSASTDESGGSLFSKWFGGKWNTQLGILYYQEADDRVQAIEPAIAGSWELSGERIWSYKFVYDSLTGASPNGALISDKKQTFTKPSGQTYDVEKGELPLDSSFEDTRTAFTLGYAQPLSKDFKFSLGGNYSSESDYVSLGANTSLSWELNQKNTVLNLGFSYQSDSITATGGTPDELAEMSTDRHDQPKEDTTEKKTLTDVLLGVTQVVNRKWIVQANYSYGQSNGYHNDPYKLVTLADGTSGSTYGDPVGYVYEKRPSSRVKHAIFLGSKYHLGAGVLDTSYRYYFDDWGIKSHTIDLGWIWKVAKLWRVEPSFRYYSQSAADFYTPSIKDSDSLPDNASADTRLAEFVAYTPGLKITKIFENESSFSLRGEYYMQRGNKNPSQAFGSEKDQDLFPDFDAIIVQSIYEF
ncbi:MAG: DUF3570 domain-containing protein [Bdellovibrionales bacterium]|nr:DUF3570 domain-containing protein [Bdellovibrionales bacterium]